MDKVKILADLKLDYNSCKTPKTKVDNAIVGWIRQYNGDAYGNEVKGRSSIVIKDIKKAIKKMSPSIIQPFIAGDTTIKARAKTIESQGTAGLVADILNYQYNHEFDKLQFIRTIANVFPKEGTIWVRTGWEYEVDTKEKSFDGLGLEELQVLQSQGDEIKDVKQNGDGTFSLTVVKHTTLYNRPTAVVCRNEAIFADPTAEKSDDCKFVIHQYEKSLSDLLKMSSVYPDLKSQVDEIKRHLDSDKRMADTSLGSKRHQDGVNTGQDLSFKFSSISNKKVTLLEYWGEYDIDDSGKSEQIVCTWIKDSDICIRLEKNPYPDKKIPFVSEVYEIEPFSIWGRSLADSISDNQKIHTAIARGFLDNLSLSNNGQKFFRKGALDYVNQQKLLNGEKYIEVTDVDAMRDGSYNQIPQSAFNVYSMQDKEIEDLTGVSSNLDGIDSATLGRSAGGVQSVMSAAQRHMVVLVGVISNLYKKMFERWHAYNQVFLDEQQVFDIGGKLARFSKDDISGTHTLEVLVNVDSMNQQKVQQINMLLQQTQALRGAIPPMTIPFLVAEIFSSFGKEEEADAIRNYQPQPDPMQQQLQQLEMAKLQAEIAEIQARTQAHQAKAQATETQSGLHEAKKDNTDMDTLLKSKQINTNDGAMQQQEMQMKQEQAYQDMRLKEQAQMQDMAHKADSAQLDHAIKISQHKANLAMQSKK